MSELKVGDKAPLFEGVNQNNETIKSYNFLGKKVIVFFYPKASTPGCTAEACDLRDNYERFLNKNYEVIGISADSVKRQKNFSDKNNL
ncbi:MAG: peroxiredoxin, partial [Lutimonas sp.]